MLWPVLLKPWRMSSKFLVVVAAVLIFTAGCSPSTRIVFFGDSITEAGAQPGGYVALLEQKFQDHGNPSVEVIGAGISGNKVPDLLARLDRDVLSHNPTHVVIYIGINDVWHHFEFDHVTGTDPDTYREGLTMSTAPHPLISVFWNMLK